MDGSPRTLPTRADEAGGTAVKFYELRDNLSYTEGRVYYYERVDGIVLGCTEIPLLLGDEAKAPDLLKPLQLLAEAAVSHALT